MLVYYVVVFLLITLSTLLVHSSEGIPSGTVENIKEFLEEQQNKLEALTEVFRQQNESQHLQIEKQQLQIKSLQEQINAQQHTTLSLLHVVSVLTLYYTQYKESGLIAILAQELFLLTIKVVHIHVSPFALSPTLFSFTL